jgi:hypothetical protein
MCISPLLRGPKITNKELYTVIGIVIILVILLTIVCIFN